MFIFLEMNLGTESLSLNLLKYQPTSSLMKATLAENR